MKATSTDSVAIALALAEYTSSKQKLRYCVEIIMFIGQIYWARDLIFLFVDGEKLATEAWMVRKG